MFRIILGMSQQRKKIINYLDGVSKEVAMHIAKCVMYGNSLGRYDHWIHELAIWISDGNDMVCKPNDKKLKSEDYEDSIFGFLGDARSDAKVNLHELQRYNKKFEDESYPYVEDDDEMIDRMFNASQLIIRKLVPIMSVKNNLDRRDIEGLIHDALDDICLK